MKTRSGFVSNSSSTSFLICTPKEFEVANKHNMTLIKCSNILYALLDIQETTERIMSSLPWFLNDRYRLYAGYSNAIEELNNILKGNPEACITLPMDRDWVSELDIELPIFESDL